MKFCPDCGSRMRPRPALTGHVFVCAKCDARIHEEHRGQGTNQCESAYIDVGHQNSTEKATSQDLSPADVEIMTEGEQEYIQRLYEYAEQYYPKFMDYAGECPDHLKGLKSEFRYKQVLVWFVAEKVLPATGKTVLEDFVEKHVAKEDPEAAARMLQMKELLEKKMSTKAIEALKLLKESGWVMRYGKLTRCFSSEVGLWWNEKPPAPTSASSGFTAL